MKDRLLELWYTITADKKRAAMLGALALVAVVLWIQKGLQSENSRAAAPRAASATTPRSAGPDATPQDRGEEIRVPGPSRLERDLFALSEAYFPWPSQTDSSGVEDPKSSDGIDDNSIDTERLNREALVRGVRDEAKRLRLRSTMLGATPVAVIEEAGSGQRGSSVLRVGQSIAGFTVIEIGTRRAVLEKHGVEVELIVPTP